VVHRTKKEFKNYNAFHDRPFGLKWGTAYALDDLMKGVRANEDYALKSNDARQQMTREEIDTVLSESFLQHKEVVLQLNLLDEFGRFLDDRYGFFKGEAYQEYFVLSDQVIAWEDVRHIEIIECKKWSAIELFDQTEKSPTKRQARNDSAMILEKDDHFYQPFYDEEGENHESK